MFWSKARLFLNWSARLKIMSGSKALQLLPQQIEIVEDGEMFGGVTELAQRGRGRSPRSSNPRSSIPRSDPGRAWSGAMASNRARTLSFFFTQLFRAFEFAGEQIVHHQRGDVGGDLQVLLSDRRP